MVDPNGNPVFTLEDMERLYRLAHSEPYHSHGFEFGQALGAIAMTAVVGIPVIIAIVMLARLSDILIRERSPSALAFGLRSLALGIVTSRRVRKRVTALARAAQAKVEVAVRDAEARSERDADPTQKSRR
jgi:hypothetical protein